MNKRNKILLGIGLIIVGVLLPTQKKSKYKEDDINLLLPSFRNKIEQLLNRMRQRGFDPILFDTFRTQAEADKYAAKGVGIKGSMHVLRAAADIISASTGWSNPKFFTALGHEANILNLTWGGEFQPDKKDYDHVQAIPVNLEHAFRLLPSDLSRDSFILNYYAGLDTNPNIS